MIIVEDFYANRPLRFYDNFTPTLRADRQGLKVITDGESTYKDTWTRGEYNGMKINSFFCGAGGFDLGFIRAGFEVAGAWDFDKYAVESYRHNIGDHVKQMSVLDMKGSDVPKANGWLFGFPCQDISVAGKQAGMVKGETRSGLFYEIMRLLGEVDEKPEWILAENVKAVNKFIPTILEEYEAAGYTLVDPQLYNTKFWFLPQNRERYFLMGIRSDLAKTFVFPTEQKEFIPKLSSILETEVDEKYYISDEKAAKIIEQAIEGLKVKQATKKGYDIAVEGDSINISHPNSKTRRGRVGKQVAQTLLTGTEQVVVLKEQPELERVAGLFDKDGQRKQAGSVWNKEGLAPTLKTPSGGYSEPMIVEEQPKILTVGNTNPSGRGMNGNVFDSEGLAPTLTTNKGEGIKIIAEKSGLLHEDGIGKTLRVGGKGSLTPKHNYEHLITPQYRVRKLTPREYARLQGFPDSYEQVVSNSQFYKQMGNAVSVTVSHAIAQAIKEQF